MGKRICLTLSNGVILLCAIVLFWGTWKQHQINASMTAAVVGLSMIWVFGVTYFTGAAIAVIAFVRLIRAITGTTTPEEMARFTGEFDVEERHK